MEQHLLITVQISILRQTNLRIIQLPVVVDEKNLVLHFPERFGAEAATAMCVQELLHGHHYVIGTLKKGDSRE
jgi:hypothetical protein